MLKKFFAVAIVGTIAHLSSSLEIGPALERVATTQNLALSQSEAKHTDKYFTHMTEAAQIDSASIDSASLHNHFSITPADSLMLA